MPGISRTVKRVCALALSLVMVLSMNVSTLAEGDENGAAKSPYTITIVPNTNTKTPTLPEDGTTYEPEELVKRFQAYAIFTGQLNTSASAEGGYDPGTGAQKPPAANQLADVIWGSGIKEENIGVLLYALTQIDAKLGGDTAGNLGLSDDAITKLEEKYDVNGDPGFTVTAETSLGAMFTQALTTAGYTVGSNAVSLPSPNPKDLTLANTASIIAGVISDINTAIGTDANNSALAREFAKVIAKRNAADSTTGVLGEYVYLDTTNRFTSDWTANAYGSSAAWTISGLESAGYYLIVDTYNEKDSTATASQTEEDEISDYILAVFGKQTVKIKSNGATVDKTIKGTTNANGNASTADKDKGASAGIGDEVTFQLKGTLPENFDNYTKFQYIFHDTLSTGLTYKTDSVIVKAKVRNPEYHFDKEPTDPANDGKDKYISVVIPTTADSNTYYEVIVPTALQDGHSLDVKFADLKKVLKANEIKADGTVGSELIDIKLTSDAEIYVEYVATINDQAVVMNPGSTTGRNSNSVGIEYSNDVNDENSTGTTTNSTVYVYVYGLDVDKVDGSKENIDPDALPGAGFALTKIGKTGATLYTIKSGDGATTKTLTESELLNLLGKATTDEISDWNMTLKELNPDISDEYDGWTIECEGDMPATEPETATYYAIFTKKETAATANGDGIYTKTYEYTIVSWMKADAVTALIAANGASAWEKSYAGTDLSGSAPALTGSGYYLTLKTVNTDGTGADADHPKEKLLVKGLDEGAYTLSEKVTPAGFDTMADITFTITPTIADADDADHGISKGDLTDVAAEIVGGEGATIVTQEDGQGKVIKNSYVPMRLVNMPAGYLPGTGGAGTAWFYVGGAVLLALAFAGMLMMNRKRLRKEGI